LNKAASKLIRMTGNKYLLDTNIISAWLEDEKIIANNMDNAAGIFIPVIVVGEMYYGARYSTKVEHNINNISKAISHYPILPIDENTCEHYGIIKASLRKKGRPIPENDIWISAIASNIILQLLQEIVITKILMDFRLKNGN
jgi:tRNA(fMet)-specific endonuclease VapC